MLLSSPLFRTILIFTGFSVFAEQPLILHNPVSVSEGSGIVSVPIELREISDETMSFSYRTLSGGILSDEDYVPVEGEVIFPAGEKFASVQIEIIDDAIWEYDESLFIQFNGPNGSESYQGRIQVTIIDDEQFPRIGINNVTINEPASEMTQVTVEFEILNNPSYAEVIIQFETIEGTATNSDFEPIEGEVRIAPGEMSATANINIFPDEITEASEYFDVRIKQIQRAFYPDLPARITILDSPSAWSDIEWILPEETINSQFPFEVTMQAVNSSGTLVLPEAESFDLSIVSEVPTGTIILSGVFSRSLDIGFSFGSIIQVANASSQPVDLSGWSVLVYDQNSVPLPIGVYTFNKSRPAINAESNIDLYCYPASYGTPQLENAIDSGFNAQWKIPGLVDNMFIGALILDPEFEVHDSIFISTFDEVPEILGPDGNPLNDFDKTELNLSNLYQPSNTRASYAVYRSGMPENSLSEGWQVMSTQASWDFSSGFPWNANSNEPIMSNSGDDLSLENGLWSGSVDMERREGKFKLLAEFESGRTFTSPALEAVPGALFRLEGSSILTEAGTPELGSSEGELLIIVNESFSEDLELSIETSPSDQIDLGNGTWTLPAGATQTTIPLKAFDDSMIDGVQDVTIRVSHPEIGSLEHVIEVWDNEPNKIGSSSRSNVFEGALGMSRPIITVSLESPSDLPVRVQVRHNLEDILNLDEEILFEPGETMKQFSFKGLGDALLNVDRETGWVEFSSGHWDPWRIEFEIQDDVTIQFLVDEEDAIIQEGYSRFPSLRLTDGRGFDQEVEILVLNSNPERVLVPDTITVPPDVNNIDIPVIAIDNEILDGDSETTLTFTIPDITDRSFEVTLKIIDNEPDEVRLHLTLNADHVWILEFDSQLGFDYVVETSSDLQSGSWSEYNDIIPGADAIQIELDLTTDATQYFRVRIIE